MIRIIMIIIILPIAAAEPVSGRAPRAPLGGHPWRRPPPSPHPNNIMNMNDNNRDNNDSSNNDNQYNSTNANNTNMLI